MKFLAVSSFALLFLNQVLAKPAEGCLQNYTIVETDSCFSVAAQFKITEPEFYAMNPGLHHSIQHNCDNLDTGKPFCVCMKEPCAVATVPAAPAAANSTAPATAAPSGVSSGVPSSLASASGSASGASSLPPSASASGSANAPSTPASSSSGSTASSVAQTGSSASSLTTTFGAITIGLVMAATTVLL